MEHYNLYDGTELFHHGVKGMKWGYRKDKRESHRDKKRRINKELAGMNDKQLNDRLNRLRNEAAYRQLNGIKSHKFYGDVKQKTRDKAAESVAKVAVVPLAVATGYASTKASNYVNKIVIPAAERAWKEYQASKR